MSGDESAAGARIARARRRRGLSQSVLAGLVGRSESWLSQVERGKRGVDSYAVLTRMAEVLRVDVEELTGPGGGDGKEGQRVYEPAAEIERAMMGYEAVGASIGGREPGARATAAHLRARASAAYAGYQATRYDDTGRILPALIREAEAAGGDDQEACSVRAMVYDTTAALLHRVGETSLAWTAADRALAAAEQSGRPELTAVQAYRLTYVLAGRKHPAEAMASDAGLRGEMRPPGQISRRGCLFALLALVITATMLTWAALFALHRIFPAPPAVWSAGGEQFAQLSSLQGTWQDSAGGKMIFTGPRFTAAASGGIIAGGTVTFAGVPQVFSWAAGPPPPSYGHGTWQAGTSSRSMMGLQDQPEAGIISIQFGTGTPGTYPLVGLEVEGPASAPSFLCQYPDPANTCTFRKIS